jgi:acyl dehydratase
LGSIEAIEGKGYGPYPVRVCAEKVADFVRATTDDRQRWTAYAPPGWAAAALFVVAPKLLRDPDLGDAASSVIHGEQRFGWVRPIPVEADLLVTGNVSRVRSRGGVWFTSFEFEARDDNGPVVNGTSTFLMAGGSPPASSDEPAALPAPHSRGSNDALPESPDGFPTFRRSASRSDLVSYAGATADWNPVHWDHESAVAAGFPTIVVHGLLQAAWLLSAASTLSKASVPIAEARFRFRSPLLAGAEATVVGDAQGPGVTARLVIGDQEIVSATMVLR